ncbi:MAG TPA: response regulator [Bacteroidia bacterium]|jgi:DNA-binding NarL/FixJ family response regulator
MKPRGKFVFIDDDHDEHVAFRNALAKICNNEVLSAYDGEQGFRLLKENKDDIFLVICDINMPKINGLELKRLIEGTPELKMKAIPFIFHSTHDSGLVVKEAYSLGIQGFVRKADDFTKSVSHLDIIVKFWSSIVHPNVQD